MAAWLLVTVSFLFLSTTVNGQSPTIRLPFGPIRPAPILSGALARELDQTPGLLELAAETLTRVYIQVESAEETIALREGVNANIDCQPWLLNFPGGSIRWLFRPRDVFGEFTEPTAAEVESTDRTVIGGDFDRWLNITSTIIAAGAENPTQGDYICEVCIARGIPQFENCHNGTTTVHLLGAPPQLVKGSGRVLRTLDGGALDVNIGDNVCINRSVIPAPAINLNCELARVDLNTDPPTLSAIPIPLRTYTFTDDEPGSDPVQIYNETDRAATPVGSPEFYAGLRGLLDPATPLGGVQNFVLTDAGSIRISTDITANVTDDVLPGLLPQRDREFVQDLLTDQLLGTYTCTVENVYGSDTATTVISECGNVAVHPGCPAPVISPRADNTAPIGCTVCIARRSTVTLDCTVAGGNPRYRWIDAGNRLVSTQSTLMVSREGNFTCNATNDDTPQGAVLSSVVRFAPEISFSGEIRSTNFGARRDTGCERLNPPLMNPPDLCVFVGETVSFTCVDQNNMPMNVTNDGGMIISDVTVTAAANMTFTCNVMMADDPCSNVMPTMTVQVFDPARIDRGSMLGINEIGVGRSTSVQQVSDGDSVTLRCPISGVEDPSGVWSYYGPPDVEGVVNRTNAEDVPRVSITTNTASDVTLQITDFDRSLHGGMFVCGATNRAGSDEAFVSLTDLNPNAVEWVTGSFGECNVQCNGGSRVRSVVCRRVRDCNIRPNFECDATIRPASMQSCAGLFSRNCLLTPIFVAGSYGSCSEGCKGGFRERDVTCVVPQTGEVRPRDDCLWSNQREPRPKQFCFNRCCAEDLFDACSRINPGFCNDPVVQQNCCWTCLLRVRY